MANQPDSPPATLTGQAPGPVPERRASRRSPKLRLRGIAAPSAQLAGQAVRIMMHRLHPGQLPKSPVLLVVTVAAVLTTAVLIFRLAGGAGSAGFTGQIAAWLWITVAALTSGEAIAEARGRARAGNLRGLATQPTAKLLLMPYDLSLKDLYEKTPAHALEVGEVVLVEAGDVIPADGEVIEGVAAVDEAAVTGESAPVIRESGGDRSAVIGGTRVVSDWLVVRVTAKPGDSFHGHVIALIEEVRHRAASRQARLTLPLVGLALGVVIALAVLRPEVDDPGGPFVFLTALLVALLPTTTVGLLAAVAVAGMDRLVRANVIAKSGEAVDAAGTTDTVHLDKTGTITFGGRTADAFLPLPGVTERELAEAAVLASHGDETPEGKSIVGLGKRKHGIVADPADIREVFPFSAQTRMSGARLVDGSDLRKGAEDAVLRHAGLAEPAELKALVERVARSGGTPLAVARNDRVLGDRPSQGHREAGPAPAVRPACRDGDPHGDGDR